MSLAIHWMMAILTNSHLASRFTKTAQDAGLVPIIEFKLTGDSQSKLERVCCL